MKTVRNLDQRFSRYFILKFRFYKKKRKNCSDERARRNQRVTHVKHGEEDDVRDEREANTCRHDSARGDPFVTREGTFFNDFTATELKNIRGWARQKENSKNLSIRLNMP